MNLHCICNKCHTIAGQQETLYLAKLREYDSALLDWIFRERLKQRHGLLNFRHTLANQKKIAAWVKWAQQVNTLAEFRKLPRWQMWEGDQS